MSFTSSSNFNFNLIPCSDPASTSRINKIYDLKNDEYEKEDNKFIIEQEFTSLVDNMKIQLVLFELHLFFKKLKRQKNEIVRNYMSNLRFIKFLITILYISIIFFEKPFWCYRKTTFSTLDESNVSIFLLTFS